MLYEKLFLIDWFNFNLNYYWYYFYIYYILIYLKWNVFKEIIKNKDWWIFVGK